MSEDTPTPPKLIKLDIEEDLVTDPDKLLIRQLKDEIFNQRQEIAVLRNKVRELEGGDGFNLPELALVSVFRHLARNCQSFNEKKNFLGCRLVCTAWRSVFDSTSDLWRKLTFSCHDPEAFLKLGCSKQVKSIRFKKLDISLDDKEDGELKKCMKEISKTIETVSFEFDRTTKRQKLLVSAFLSQSVVLRTLHIGGSHFRFPRVGLLGLPPTELKVSTLTKLKVDFDRMSVTDIAALRHLMIRLPGLRRIEFNAAAAAVDCRDGIKDTMLRVISISIDYMNKYPDELQSLHFDLNRHLTYLLFVADEPEPVWTSWVTLLLTACKHGVSVKSNVQNNFNLFLACEASIANNRAYYENILTANIEITGQVLPNVQRLSFCVNLTELEIQMEADATVEQLSGLTSMEKLSELRIYGLRGGIITRQVFTGGIPSLKVLRCDVVCFEPDIFAYFAEYFPNLKELSLDAEGTQFQMGDEKVFHTGKDFMSSLTKLKNLKLVYLRGVKLADVGWASCAEFKSLKHLSIAGSNNLSDDCLLNGICHIKTLETLKLNCHSESNPKESVFTSVGIDAICSKLGMQIEVQKSEVGEVVLNFTRTSKIVG